MPQEKCIPLTIAETKYVTRIMEKTRKSHAKELIDMRDKKNRAFTKEERKGIDNEITYLEKTIKELDAINTKLYCIYS